MGNLGGVRDSVPLSFFYATLELDRSDNRRRNERHEHQEGTAVLSPPSSLAVPVVLVGLVFQAVEGEGGGHPCSWSSGRALRGSCRTRGRARRTIAWLRRSPGPLRGARRGCRYQIRWRPCRTVGSRRIRLPPAAALLSRFALGARPGRRGAEPPPRGRSGPGSGARRGDGGGEGEPLPAATDRGLPHATGRGEAPRPADRSLRLGTAPPGPRQSGPRPRPSRAPTASASSASRLRATAPASSWRSPRRPRPRSRPGCRIMTRTRAAPTSSSWKPRSSRPSG